MRSVNRLVCFISTIIQLAYAALAEVSGSCSGGLEECGPNETCKQQIHSGDDFRGLCVCASGFHKSGSACVRDVPPTAAPSTSEPIIGSLATALLWTMGILAVLVATLTVLIRRYALLDRLYALRVRRYDTVFVSSTANVDDDAPIT